MVPYTSTPVLSPVIGTAGPFLLALVVARQIGADRRPMPASVAGLEEDVGGVIEDAVIVRRNQNGGRPLEAIFQVRRIVAGRIERIDADAACLARAVIVARDVAAVLAGINDVGIGRIGSGEAGFAAADRMPIAGRDAGLRQTVTRPRAGADVLHGAGDVIGQTIIDADVIELPPRQRRGEPGFAAVGRDVHAAIVAVEDAARIFGIDPNVVMIAVVRPFDALESFAAVDALKQRHLWTPHDVGVARIDSERGVVESALADGAPIVDELPGIAAVVAAE